MNRWKHIVEWLFTILVAFVVCCGACIFSLVMYIQDNDIPLVMGPGATDCNRHPDQMVGNPTVLAGRVVDRQTREPIAGAHVTIRSLEIKDAYCNYTPLAELTLLADDNGIFQLETPVHVALVDQLEVIATAEGCQAASRSYLRTSAFGQDRVTDPRAMFGVTVSLNCEQR